MSWLGGTARALVLAAAALGFADTAQGASTIPNKTPLAGTITLTGTDGKDDFKVTLQAGSPGTQGSMKVEPAVAMTATSGSCGPDTDALTGRPIKLECPLSGAGQVAIVIDLRKGDDAVTLTDNAAAATAVTAAGGLGNDAISIKGRGGTTVALRGDDGNDLLAAGMQLFAASNPPANFDGGAGTDTAAFAGSSVFGPGFTVDLGVTASLEAKTAVFSGLNQAQQPTTFQTDPLASIEALTGTESGDVLIGSAAGDVISGAGGNDNLNGAGGDDSLLGGADLDDLVGGAGVDTLDGGVGVDTYPKGAGGDTFLTRDGYAEDVPCFKQDTIVDDLVDRVVGASDCSISTAAAKHRYDTKLSGRPAALVGHTLLTRVRCPARKSTTCAGELRAIDGRRTLGSAPYKVRPGRKSKVRLSLSGANARRAAGRTILFSATELDADGRDRFVSRPARIAAG